MKPGSEAGEVTDRSVRMPLARVGQVSGDIPTSGKDIRMPFLATVPRDCGVEMRVGKEGRRGE